MKKVWALFDGIPEWKRKWIFIAVVVCLAGVLWESNDLIQENQDFFSGERGLVAVQYDEYGDPLALAKTKELPYAKLWSNPITRAGFVFILAFIIGSLIRSLAGGSLALILMIVLTAVLMGQGAFFEIFNQDASPGFLKNAGGWLVDQSDHAKQWFITYAEVAGAGIVGLLIGVFK